MTWGYRWPERSVFAFASVIVEATKLFIYGLLNNLLFYIDEISFCLYFVFVVFKEVQ